MGQSHEINRTCLINVVPYRSHIDCCSKYDHAEDSVINMKMYLTRKPSGDLLTRYAIGNI